MIGRLREKIRLRRRLQRREALLEGLGFGSEQREFFLVSFPRAGNTWLRLMIANLISEDDEIAFHNLSNYIPDTDQPKQLELVTNRQSVFYEHPVQIVKSHDYFSPFYRSRKVIYVVRDGVDCITSYYHYANARTDKRIPKEAFIEGGTAKIMSWRHHLLSWYEAPVSQLLLVKYEDLKADPSMQLRRVADFLELDADAEDISDAVAQTSFQKMRHLEEKYGYYNDNRVGDGRQSPFVRQGKVGQRSDVFNHDQLQRFRRLSAEAEKLYGYK